MTRTHDNTFRPEFDPGHSASKKFTRSASSRMDGRATALASASAFKSAIRL
jgi:hypothetical protein